VQNLSGRSSSKLSRKLASLKTLGDSSRGDAKVNPANFLGQFLPTSTFVAQICWHLLSLLLVLLSLQQVCAESGFASASASDDSLLAPTVQALLAGDVATTSKYLEGSTAHDGPTAQQLFVPIGK